MTVSFDTTAGFRWQSQLAELVGKSIKDAVEHLQSSPLVLANVPTKGIGAFTRIQWFTVRAGFCCRSTRASSQCGRRGGLHRWRSHLPGTGVALAVIRMGFKQGLMIHGAGRFIADETRASLLIAVFVVAVVWLTLGWRGKTPAPVSWEWWHIVAELRHECSDPSNPEADYSWSFRPPCRRSGSVRRLSSVAAIWVQVLYCRRCGPRCSADAERVTKCEAC